MISRRSFSRSSRWTSPYSGTSCSIRRRIRSVAETFGLIPSSSKCWRLRGLLTRAIVRSTRYFSFATWQISMLSSSSPVTAITRSAREMPTRSSTHSSDASPYCTLCSSSCSTARYRSRSPSIAVTSCPFSSSSRARFQPTFPAPAMITYMGASSLVPSRRRGRLASALPSIRGSGAGPARAAGRRAHLRDEHFDRHRRRADRVHALALVPIRSQRVQDARDHRGDVEPPLRDLRDDDVGVVAIGGGDERLGPINPRRLERFDLERGADGEVPAGLLPRLLHPDFEARMRLGVLVEARHLMPVAEHGPRDGRANPPATDDENEHEGEMLLAGPCAIAIPSDRRRRRRRARHPARAGPFGRGGGPLRDGL